MSICDSCNNSFPRLEQNQRCQKCRQLKPGLSQSELQTIRYKPQCAACGLVFSTIPCAICQACLDFYSNEKAVPCDILQLKGVAHLLFHNTPSVSIPATPRSDGPAAEADEIGVLASAVLSRAAIHRTDASDTRLTVGPPKTAQNLSSKNKFPNLTKATQLLAERNKKKAEARLREGEEHVTIVASLWHLDGRLKPTEVSPPVHIQRTFSKFLQTKDCLDELLNQARIDFEKSNPEAEPLTWQNVILRADTGGGAGAWASLTYFDRSQSLGHMFEEFRIQKFTSESLLKSKTIKIRFEIVSSESLESSADSSRSQTSSLKSLKRPRTNTSSSIETNGLSTRSKTARIVTSAAQSNSNPGNVGRTSAPVILRSAFKAPSATQPSRWSRNPPMEKHSFIRTTASISPSGEVTLNCNIDQQEEIIEIATDWLSGEEAFLKKETYDTTGFIGRGATKRAIYARCGGKEYSLTQNFDEQTTPDEVARNLAGEYELLAQCDWFKAKFNEFALNSNVTTLPGFYFNYPSSIFGELKPSLGSGGRRVPFRHFIATPLLPCGKVDSRVHKFTGSDDFGDASDNLTKAVHAFVHFAFVYSDNYILFCDLQGCLDARGVMCLFDPQAHTNTESLRANYWDAGPKAISRLISQHEAVCKDNWVCQRLSLDNIQLENPPSSPSKGESDFASGHPQNPMNVNLLLNK